MNRIQAEHKEWLAKMYPDQTRMFPLAGLVEESAELLHAVLKLEQAGVWGPEQRYRGHDWRPILLDAFGDCGVFLCSYCNTVGWDFAELIGSTARYTWNIERLNGALKVVKLAVDFAADDTRERAVLYVVELREFASSLGIDLEDAVRTAWVEVRGRTRGP